MSDLLQINLNKLKFVFLFSALALGTLICIILIYAYNANQFPPSNLLIQIVLGSLIAMPIFICVIALSTWFVANKQQKKFFDKVKESHLNPLGFTPIIINAGNRWKFADEVYALENTPQEIILRQNKHQKSNVEFCFYKGSFDEYLIERDIKMTKKEFCSMSSDNIKSMLLKTTLS